MIKNFFKGMVVGVANIIPGVSGGTMMVSMGIYDKLIYCITHLFSKFKENLKFLLPIFIGAGVALLGLSFVIEPAFEYFPLPTNLLFIGLIFGGIPAILKRLKDENGKIGIKFSYLVLFALFAALVVIMAIFKDATGTEAILGTDLWSLIKLFGVGIIASATMVIPGVSGSMMLLLLGYYNPIIETINSFVKAVVAFDFAAIWSNTLILIPSGLGVVFGIFAIAKVIEIVLSKFPFHTFWAILGLVAASPVGIIIASGITSVSVLSVIASVVTFAIGFVVSMKLGD